MEDKPSIQDIKKRIESIEFHCFFDRVTVCCLKTVDGFYFTGESVNQGKTYNQKLHQETSYHNAIDKIFDFEEYLKKHPYIDPESRISGQPGN